MFKVFTIDPSLVREALLAGRTLVVEVSDRHHKVTVGPLSTLGPHATPDGKYILPRSLRR